MRMQFPMRCIQFAIVRNAILLVTVRVIRNRVTLHLKTNN